VGPQSPPISTVAFGIISSSHFLFVHRFDDRNYI